MDRVTLVRRSLLHHWRAHVAVALGVAAAGAALTGALLVGDSMRASLRDTALDRLGGIDQLISAPRFFREALADEIAPQVNVAAPFIVMRGGVTHALAHARAERVNVLGVNDAFWSLHGADRPALAEMPDGSKAILNQTLADELGAQVGDPLILRLARPQDVSIDTLLGRRAETLASARVTVAAIIAARDLGAFSLEFQQQSARNIFLPLDALQRILKQPGKINALAIRSADQPAGPLTEVLAERLTLGDFGLSLRTSAAHGYVALESDAFLLPPALESAARRAAAGLGAFVDPVLAYLANEISCGQRAIPYSTVAALDPFGAVFSRMHDVDNAPAGLAPGGALLNAWAAADLNARVGDRITLTYYVSEAFGRLATRTSDFTLSGIVPLAGLPADPDFTPPYAGVTDVKRLADWDPPFPLDLSRVRPQDEEYWEIHRTTPKAFIAYIDGKRLWTSDNPQHGNCTSLRFTPRDYADVAALAERLRAALRAELSPALAGFAVQDVRAAALDAVAGSTDFSGLFIGFSFFLIAAAILLVALLFRLGVDRRSAEVGIMLASGFAPRRVSRLLLVEGALVACVGAVLGVLAGIAYARLLIAGLRSVWAAAVNAPFLHFAGSAASYAIGFAATVLVALPALFWGMRNLQRQSVNRLLAGAAEVTPAATPGTRAYAPRAALLALAVGLALLASTYVTNVISAPLAFFLGGAALLVAGAALAAVLLTPSAARTAPHASRWRALVQLGVRNAPRHRGRSLLIVALIASATFVTTALQTFRMQPDEDLADLHGGHGGFALIAECSAPLPFDLNTPAGREDLNLSPATRRALDAVTAMPFRLRPGDSTSCLNLYAPGQPRILGAPCAMLERGGFRFSKTRATTDATRRNPWLLLRETPPDGVIPVIGDEASVLWQLHSGLGQTLTITDDSGHAHALQFVALLKGSALQGELIIAEEQFKRLFPSIAGHAFFLIEAPEAEATQLATRLEADLEPYGLDVVATRERLRSYFAVQNTYLSTFQLLGGLGILLGSIGVVAVMLRNVWERRRELALMQVLGFSRWSLIGVVVVENAALILGGLLLGVLAALIAVLPQVAADPGAVSWGTLALVVAGVPILGIVAAAAVLTLTLRAPLLPALRRE